MGELGDAAPRRTAPPARWWRRSASTISSRSAACGRSLAEAASRPAWRTSACTSVRRHEEIASAVRELLHGNDWVLVKGSRSMKMERVVEALAAPVEGR